MVGSCHGGQLSPVGSCPRWAVVAGGQLSTVGSCHGGQLSRWAVVHSGQLSPVGSCPRWAVVAGGQLSRGAAVGWADVGWAVVGWADVGAPSQRLNSSFFRI